MKTAEHYVTNSSEIDLSKCTFIPEAPRIDKKEKGHSEASNERSKSPSKLISRNFFNFTKINHWFHEISGKLVSSPKKSLNKSPKKSKKSKSKESDKAEATTKEIKNEKALNSINPKSITNDQISKWIKAGDVEKMELAVLAGKGQLTDNL